MLEQGAPGDAARTPVVLAAYRERVSRVTARVDDGHAGPLATLLQGPEVATVLAAAGDPQQIVGRAEELCRCFANTRAATARTRGEQLRIFLLQQIDLAWWRDAADFETPEALRRDPDIVELGSGVPARVRYHRASDAYLHRARNLVVRRVIPARRPATAGVTYPFAQDAVVRMLELVAARFAVRGGGPLWVNSLARPVSHQRHLQQLGFTAFIPSAHCRGWAADVETAWYEHAGTRGILEDLLREMTRDGVLNGIDEGRIWHLCPHPDWVARTTPAHGARTGESDGRYDGGRGESDDNGQDEDD